MGSPSIQPKASTGSVHKFTTVSFVLILVTLNSCDCVCHFVVQKGTHGNGSLSALIYLDMNAGWSLVCSELGDNTTVCYGSVVPV